ncbi:MAG: ABC transporter ATP-binding protein [Planctomycetota bacterium]|nr:ABC transporter ATP-binding protein [Planctomycetota bacterium]
MLQQSSEQPSGAQLTQRELLRELLAELLLRLDVPHELSAVSQSLSDAMLDDARTPDALAMSVMRAGTAVGLRMAPLELSMVDIWELLLDEFPVAVVYQSSTGEQHAAVFSHVAGGRVDATLLSAKTKRSDSLTRRQLSALLSRGRSHQYFIAEPSLSCEKMTSSHEPDQARIPKVHDDHDSHHHAEHISPQKRLLRLLKLESKDIWALGVFTLVVSFLDLATPLAVEQMVTTIGFASVVQPLIWIALLLFAILTLSAVIKALQVFIVEILQRRMIVRIVGDLAERLPRLERSAMDGIHGPELANRFFDVMTMQKATASLLLDLLALAIQTLAGLLLLAVYSPYLLAFDLILLMAMTVMIYALGRGGVRTAIEESLIKYRIAHWLQDIIGNPNAFQVHGGGSLAVDRANRLVVEYLGARRKHFAVLIRQSLFALLLYAVSISALLSLGGWLVLNNALTIGQLVASVSVVAVVVGAFSKVGKSLESFYDLMAATDKVGHLIDLPTVPPTRPLIAGIGPVEVRFRDLVLHTGREHIAIPNILIPSAEHVAICCEGHSGKTLLLQTIAGLRNPYSGLCEIGGIDSRDVNRFADGSMVGFASDVEIFHGTLQENITLNRLSIHDSDLRDALQLAGLWDEVLSLPMGLDTMLQTDGFPLSRSQAHRLMIARAIVSRPRLLLIDGSLDKLGPRLRQRVWDNLRSDLQPWTMLVVTHDLNIINSCDKRIELTPPENAHH